MSKYKVIGGKGRTIEASSDKVVAVALAKMGDYGYKANSDLQMFPAGWTWDEFAHFLGMPLPAFERKFADEISAAIKSFS